MKTMKANVRRSVFETNSSSMHSLCIRMPKEKEWKIDKRLIDKNGVIKVACDEFDCCGIVSTQYEKLQYLCTYIALDEGRGQYTNADEFTSEDSSGISSLLRAIQEKDPSVEDIRVVDVDRAYFDHQTCPFESACCVNLYSDEAIQSFIFSDQMYIKMERD